MTNTEQKLWTHLHQDHGLTLTESELGDALHIAREGLPSPAALRLANDEVKAANEALELVMTERDALEARLVFTLRENLELGATIEALMVQVQNATTDLLRAADAQGGVD